MSWIYVRVLNISDPYTSCETNVMGALLDIYPFFWRYSLCSLSPVFSDRRTIKSQGYCYTNGVLQQTAPATKREAEFFVHITINDPT